MIPTVYVDHHAQPLIVFAKGRKLYHAIQADTTVRIVTLDTLRGLRELKLKDKPYPAKRAASFYLNHTAREVTKRAKQVLRGLVARANRKEPDAKP